MKLVHLAPWSGARSEWTRAAARHLFLRAGFGASRERLERALSAGLDSTLDEMFSAVRHSTELEASADSLVAAGRIEDLQAWWMALILADDAPLVERMTLFWHDHFATSQDKVDDARLMLAQNRRMRALGMGDFRLLLHAMAEDPAMLLWLDGDLNKRGHANENFAREVMELFALGIGNYTERDVVEAARAFTGWGTQGRAFVVREDDHDDDTKSVFGRSGCFRGEDVIDLLIEHPACARHVARRLLEEFVGPEPRSEWIEETARVLLASEWNVGRTLRSILASELFFSAAARRVKIAGPVELLAATALALGAALSPKDAARAVTEMGQALFRPPSVKGWDGMRSWIDAGKWVARHNALVRLARSDGRVRVDLATACGSPQVREGVPHAVREVLMPGVDDSELDRTLVHAAAESANVAEALVLVVSLVLTSPAYHLV